MLGAMASVNAQESIYFSGFDGSNANMDAEGWIRTNQSSPSTTTTWGNGAWVPPIASPLFGGTTPVGQEGGLNSFAFVNYSSTGTVSPTGTLVGTGTISNWFITPEIPVKDGDIVSFWTRKGTESTSPNADFADRLEFRMSTAATTVVPSGGSAGLGSFTTLGLSVNPNLLTGFVYPKVWTKYTYVVSGVPTETLVRFAFRYFVTNAGPEGLNSDMIGIDSFGVDRTLSTNDFFAKNFSMYPNPANGIVTLSAKNNTAINSVQITDLNGRIVKNSNTNGISEAQINISDLNTGMYFVTVKTDAGSGTKKKKKN